MVRWDGVLQGAEFGVRVNSVAPGPVDTPILEVIPRERLLHLVEASQLIPRITQPEEVRAKINEVHEQRLGWFQGCQAWCKADTNTGRLSGVA